MNVFDFFKKNGIDTIDKAFFRSIDLWRSWYRGDVNSFHHYKIYNGTNHIKRKRKTLGMAKKVCEDTADLLLNERVKITLSDKATNDFVNGILEENNFWDIGNEYQERKAATGTVAYIPYLVNTEIDENGNIMSGEISINFVEARNIYPLSWKNNRITECVFMFSHTVNQKKYALFQFHRLEVVDGVKQYVVTNRVVKCSAGAGQEIPHEEWGQLASFSGLAYRMETWCQEPQFVIDRLNIANNVDDDDSNPMGISIFANALPVLQKIDLEYDSYSNEFELGKKRIFVAGETLNFLNGNPTFDPDDIVFYQLPEDSAMKQDGKKMIEESNMTIRTEEHSKAINDDLNFLSFKCGFGTERYRFEKGNVTTATQVISENSDMYRTIKKHELILGNVLKELVRIIIRLGYTAGNDGLNMETDITIDFDDSIIEDKQSERQQDRNDVAMGAMSLVEYRMKWYSEDKSTAEKNVPEQNVTMPDDVKVPAFASGVRAEVQGKQLNGAQTQSLIAIMSQYSAGDITEGQAVNLISTAIGISKEEARALLNGDME